MAEAKMLVARPNTTSPPPNCAICLGPCTNKCFSNSCMHQFCFKCLLEWSKIKAECPLCKQPFKKIIHNIKSNEDYDEYIVVTEQLDDIHIIDNEQHFFLPSNQQFHFRTTFTVDTRGEHAIQQFLLTHALSNTHGYTRPRRVPRVRDNSATTFRRSVYSRNLWVHAPPDVSGRYREATPEFFRLNPGARQRLVPWLNRELNALLMENTQLIMNLVDIILDNLMTHHICSPSFRTMLYLYLNDKTDHFLHEFYNFMRSPYDMIGYDRHVIYTEVPRSPLPFIDVSDNDSDSDVIIVSAPEPQPVVIDLLDSDSDEPVLVSEEPPPEAPREPIMPLKLRLKHKKSKSKKKRKRRESSSRSDSSSSSSSSNTVSNSSSSSSTDSYEAFRKRHKRKRRKLKLRKRESSVSSRGSESDIPLAAFAKKKHKKHKKRKSRKNRSKEYCVEQPLNLSKEVGNEANEDSSSTASLVPTVYGPSCSYSSQEKSNGYSEQFESTPSTSAAFATNGVQSDAEEFRASLVKSEISVGNRDNAYEGKGKIKNIVLKKEQQEWCKVKNEFDSDSS